METASIPEWLATTLVAAALATLGFVGKQILEGVASVRAERRRRRARLVTLLSLLQGSAAVFRVQASLRDRLMNRVNLRKPEVATTRDGYEAAFAAAFPTLTAEEAQLHEMIRAYTVSGLKPLNEATLQWLQTDMDFKYARSRRPTALHLARMLSALEPHLLMWLAKYATWIPDNPTHALVYLADEENHGVPFPRGIESVVRAHLSLTTPGEANTG
jgi:hypothetical protein